MGLAEDIDRIKLQESKLQFTEFGANTVWAIGSHLRQAAIARSAAMTFEIQVAGRTVFMVTTDGAAAGQADWIRRKRNTVMRFGRSSYHVGLQLELDKQTIEERHGLFLTEYAAHGGGFPVVLKGTGLVGSIIASGLHQREDHNMVVAAISETLGIPDLALD